jgi:hypothetical protein
MLRPSRFHWQSHKSKMNRVGEKSLWAELTSKLAGVYRGLEQRHARLQRAKAEVGNDAFLSGHDGWFFHGGIRKTPEEPD